MTNKEVHTLTGQVVAANMILQDVNSQLKEGHEAKIIYKTLNKNLREFLRSISFEEKQEKTHINKMIEALDKRSK